MNIWLEAWAGWCTDTNRTLTKNSLQRPVSICLDSGGMRGHPLNLFLIHLLVLALSLLTIMFSLTPMDQHHLCNFEGFHTEGPRPRLKSAANGSRQVVTWFLTMLTIDMIWYDMKWYDMIWYDMISSIIWNLSRIANHTVYQCVAFIHNHCKLSVGSACS